MKNLITNIVVLSETKSPTTGFNRSDDDVHYSVIIRADVEVEDDHENIFQDVAVGFGRSKHLDGAHEIATTNAIESARAKCRKLTEELEEKAKKQEEKAKKQHEEFKSQCDKSLVKIQDIADDC